MEEILPVNIAEGAGAKAFMQQVSVTLLLPHPVLKISLAKYFPSTALVQQQCRVCVPGARMLFSHQMMDECLPKRPRVGACFPLIRRRAAPSMSMGQTGVLVCQGMGHRQACSGCGSEFTRRTWTSRRDPCRHTERQTIDTDTQSR